MLPIPAVMHQIYDGEGQHIGGMMPPLKINGALTTHFRQLAAERPVLRRISLGKPGAPGLTWMMYHGLRVYPGVPVCTIVREAFEEIVQALATGLTVDIYGDDHPVVNEMANAAKAAASRHVKEV